MDSPVSEIHLRNPSDYKRWRNFLESLDIHNFSDKEVQKIDTTLAIFSGDDLVATGSLAGNTLKYIGVCNKDVVSGSRFNTIVSALVSREFQQGIFHLFVFTKIKYSASFQHVGFNELAHTDDAAVLEDGSPDVNDYLNDIPKIADQKGKKIGSIVMNANPFTSGHRFLVEQAAKQCDLVYVFVVNTDASLFSTSERFYLVKRGTADLKNVIVVNGGDYMVSYVTFPAYFLASSKDAIIYQTTMDARIFKNIIAKGLNIDVRFIGTEPLSRTTSIYNQVLQRQLPPEVEVDEIERQTTDGNYPITATAVRRDLKDNELEEIKKLVPLSTFDFIKANQAELTKRIKEGMNINGN